MWCCFFWEKRWFRRSHHKIFDIIIVAVPNMPRGHDLAERELEYQCVRVDGL
jgi:hypothetical protein